MSHLRKDILLAVIGAIVMTAAPQPAWSQAELDSNRQIKKHKEHTQSMTEPIYRRLGAIHTLMGESNYDKALSDLNKLANATLNDHEKALVQQTFGFIYVQQNRNREALASFEKALSYDALPGNVIQGMRYSLAGLYAAEGEFLKSIETMRLWFEYEAEPKAEAYMVIASAYSELNRFDDALPYVRKAIEVSPKPVESWYMLEVAIHIDKERYSDAAGVLRRMLQIWPGKPKYWELLSSIYLQLGDDGKALNSMMVAYRNGMIKEESRIVALVQLNMLQEIPHAAGSILEDALARGTVERTRKHLDLLLQAWTDAREFDKAIGVIDQLSSLSNDGKYALRKALILNEMGRWDGVGEAVDQALEFGIDKPADAYMLKGTALVELAQFQGALAAFNKVRELGDADARRNAADWIAFVNEKIELKAALSR